MKKYFVLSLLFVSSLASAHLIDVNVAQKIVFYTPTPSLEVILTDLDDSGGMFSVSLAYDNLTFNFEREELERQYPGYTFQVLMAQHTSESLIFSIPEAGIQQETLVKQGQMGPYLNLQMLLSKEQVAKLKIFSKKSTEILKMAIPASSSYSERRVVEEYSSSSVCREIKGQNFGSLVRSLFALKRPSEIRYEETFVSYKLAIFENCFEVEPTSIASFKELLKTEIKRKSTPSMIKAVHSEIRSVDVKYHLVPKVSFQIN